MRQKTCFFFFIWKYLPYVFASCESSQWKDVQIFFFSHTRLCWKRKINIPNEREKKKIVYCLEITASRCSYSYKYTCKKALQRKFYILFVANLNSIILIFKLKWVTLSTFALFVFLLFHALDFFFFTFFFLLTFCFFHKDFFLLRYNPS